MASFKPLALPKVVIDLRCLAFCHVLLLFCSHLFILSFASFYGGDVTGVMEMEFCRLGNPHSDKSAQLGTLKLQFTKKFMAI